MQHSSPTHAVGVMAVLLSTALSACSGNQAGKAPVGNVGVVAPPSLFEQATQGFPTCDMGDLFIDEYTQRTSSPYLQAIEERRCATSDMLVTYCIDERFQGLAVTRLAVPRTTFPVFALYFHADLEVARSTLMAKLGKDFRDSPESRLGAEPELVRDPADASASVLICTKTD